MLRTSLEQMAWANNQMIDWLEAQTVPDPAALRLASHILHAERLWISRVQGIAIDKDIFRIIPVEEMSSRNAENHQDFMALLEQDPEFRIDYKLIDGSPGNSTLADIVLHIMTHGFHHRGQIAARATQLGLKFPGISWIQFARYLEAEE